MTDSPSLEVRQISLVVTDLSVALAFYSGKVGFETKTDVTVPGRGRWVTVGPRGHPLELALYPVGAVPDRLDPSGQWRPAASPPIQLLTDDCRGVVAAMQRRGVRFREAAPVEHPWGIAATFEDPDGNLFSVVQRPTGAPRPAP